MILPKLSIVIPTFNEIKTGYLEKILKQVSSITNCEVICVDSQSTDGTLDLIKSYNCELIITNSQSRGERLSLGAKAAKSELVFLHHPRTIFQNSGFEYLIQNSDSLHWGGFTHKFDHSHYMLRFTSWYSNTQRADKRGVFYLDHGIFAKKRLLEEVNYLPSIDIFEDTVISKRLQQRAPWIRLEFIALTSAIRFVKNGVWRQILLNMLLKVQFNKGSDHKAMNKMYEKNLDLNTRYKIRK